MFVLRRVAHADWMNEAVRQEIEALQRARGFKEDEALAFWHLRQAGRLMNDMWHADFLAWRNRQEQRGDLPPGWRIASNSVDAAEWHANVQQHVWALQRVLALRVLRRDYPDGWGGQYKAEDEGGEPEMEEPPGDPI